MAEHLVAIIDNSLDPEVYTPVDHWNKHLPCATLGFRAPAGEYPDLDASGITHILLTGSEASIVERDAWVTQEVEFVLEAVRRGIPILGSCWGHQLLALALSGPSSVRRSPHPELGWLPIEVHEDHRIMGGRRGRYDVFTLHFDEVVNLDARYRILASTPQCPIHAFQLEDKPVWGVQSHPEIDIEDGRRLLVNLAEQGNPNSEVFRPVLDTPARDSGLIRHLVQGFLQEIFLDKNHDL